MRLSRKNDLFYIFAKTKPLIIIIEKQWEERLNIAKRVN